MVESLTSWNNANVASGDAVNQCLFAYNDFGQLTTDYQEHSGEVNTSTTPKVQYGYADGSDNTIRQLTLTYPNGRVLTYGYGASDGIDDAISRIASLIDDDVSSTHLADYSFVGQGQFVVGDYTEPDVKYTLVNLAGTNDPDTGDIYSGWDRFGRVKDCRWYDYANSTDVARLKYGYDRASDRLWRADPVAQSLGKNFDELYSYDGLHRLKDMQRGVLNGTNTAITDQTFAQCWSLDPTSNWRGFREAEDGGSWTTVQSRNANPVNEITDITNSIGSAWVSPTYDAAGNTTTIAQPADPTTAYTGTCDAWNRLVTLVDAATSDMIQENQYDARNFRVVRTDYSSGFLAKTRHVYYTSDWQGIEERLGAGPDGVAAERQMVWGLRYIDDLVLRERDTNADEALDERSYGLQDENWNLIAIIDTTADAQERYQFSPFGMPTFLNGSMSLIFAESAIDIDSLFTGQRFDSVTMLQLFRTRWFDPRQGRFLARDQFEYINGSNVYAAWFVPSHTDHNGTSKDVPPNIANAIKKCLNKPTYDEQLACLGNLGDSGFPGVDLEVESCIKRIKRQKECTEVRDKYKDLDCQGCNTNIDLGRAEYQRRIDCYNAEMPLRQKWIDMNCDDVMPLSIKKDLKEGAGTSKRGHQQQVDNQAVAKATCERKLKTSKKP